MVTNQELIEKIKFREDSWKAAYVHFPSIIYKYNLKTGVEIGVAFGGHSESILENTSVDTLYGVDPYIHRTDYSDGMNLPQNEFDKVYPFVLERMAKYDGRYLHIRKLSKDAVSDIQEEIDFVYIDGDHSYEGILTDLRAWFPKVRIGGIIGGHDYNHPNHPDVTKAVNDFFGRFNWKVQYEGDNVWWVKKEPLNISFFIPAYNCEKTIIEAVESIVNGNFEKEDEIIVVDDGSTDNTYRILENLQNKYSTIKIIQHKYNKGPAATRNTAIENSSNEILFCLDSDNFLEKGSIHNLKEYLINSGEDIGAFQTIKFFINTKENITHSWIYEYQKYDFEKYLSNARSPGASGNYMFTKRSWFKANGYPEFARTLDTWGFGLRQVATGSEMVVLNNSYYFHRHGIESNWIRNEKKVNHSLLALQIILPYIDQLKEADVNYILSPKGRNIWYDKLKKRPIRIRKENQKNDFYHRLSIVWHRCKKFIKI